jgi:hypothetical protein
MAFTGVVPKSNKFIEIHKPRPRGAALPQGRGATAIFGESRGAVPIERARPTMKKSAACATLKLYVRRGAYGCLKRVIAMFLSFRPA